jgi:hypothetical protein
LAVVNDPVIIGSVLLEQICNISIESKVVIFPKILKTKYTKKLLSSAMQQNLDEYWTRTIKE